MAQIKICPECKEKFEGRSNQKYCSSNCKMVAYQKRESEKSSLSSSQSVPSFLKSKSHDIDSQRKLSSKEIKLKLHALDLQHQRKLILLEQQKQLIEQRAKQEEMARKIREEELAKAKAKKEKEGEARHLAEAKRKIFAPIKTATQEILLEIIENGKDSIWPVEDVEDFLEEITDTIAKVQKYCISQHLIYKDFLIYTTLKELQQELKEVLDEEEYYVNEEEVIIKFRKSYIRELQTVLRTVENGLENNSNGY